MPIVALCGEYGVGKDTLADSLQGHYQMRKYAFANPLKWITHNLYPWLPEHVDTADKDVPWPHPSNQFGLTPREIWISVSKGLKAVNEYVFFDHFLAHDFKYMTSNPHLLHVITDFRIPNEYVFLKKHNIPIIKILAPDTPETPNSFEVWIRAFDRQDMTFFNKKEGTSEWVKFFDVFYREFLKDQDASNLTVNS